MIAVQMVRANGIVLWRTAALVSVLLFLVPHQPLGAQTIPHQSAFPVERVFNVISINGKALSDRPRTFTIGLALNGNPYGVGFGGCHGWGANIETLDRSQIRIESVHVTQAQPQGTCTSEQQRSEDEFFFVLKQGVLSWRMEEQTLVLETNAVIVRMAAGAFTDKSIPPAIRHALLERGVASPAQNSVKAIFEKYDLLGTFAQDCSKPASRNNLYYVNRALDADHVQRDQMSGPTIRDWAYVIEKAAEVNANDISVSGTRDGKPTDGIWRVERNAADSRLRMRIWQASWSGKKLVVEGKLPTSGRDAPTQDRCSG